MRRAGLFAKNLSALTPYVFAHMMIRRRRHGQPNRFACRLAAKFQLIF
jgi:hypothetical protein